MINYSKINNLQNRLYDDNDLRMITMLMKK